MNRRAVLAGVVVGAVTLADYLAWLAWNRHDLVSADGRVIGTYHAWQVLGFVVVLALVGDRAGRRGLDQPAAVAAGLVTGACMAVDNGLRTDVGGYFVVGAVISGLAVYAGMRAIAWFGREIDAGRWDGVKDFVVRHAHLPR